MHILYYIFFWPYIFSIQRFRNYNNVHNIINFITKALAPHCITLESAISEINWCDRKNVNLRTLESLFKGKDHPVSKAIAAKIAGSGLTYGHLKCVLERSGPEGLTDLLQSKVRGSVRVTARENIINKIIAYLQK